VGMVKLMVMAPSRLNNLYKNSERAKEGNGSWQLRIYSSPDGLSLKNLIIDALKMEDVWSEEFLTDLRTRLQVLLAHTRTLLGENGAEEYWNEQADLLSTQLEACRNYLPSSLTSIIEKIALNLSAEATKVTTVHTTEVLKGIRAAEGAALVVPETPKLGHYYQQWIDTLTFDYPVKVLTNKGEISSMMFLDFDLIVFPGAPSRYRAREKFDTYLRALLLSGLAPKAIFVAPDWSSTFGDLTFEKTLFEGLELSAIPTLRVNRDTSTPSEPDLQDVQVDFERVVTSIDFGDFEVFESGGSSECKLIQIGPNLAYPIEADSQKVQVLSRSQSSGEWNLSFKHPFKELEIGDILVACVGSSEMEALRSRASEDMGDKFAHFQKGQDLWKSALKERAVQLGLAEFENELKTAKVRRFARAKYWWHPDAIQPGYESDFIAILQYLGFPSEEMKMIISLAREFDGSLIKAGRQAGQAILEYLDESDFESLEMKKSVEVTLENFGDATYLLAPVIEVSPEIISCQPSQVRRVISVPREVHA